MFARTTVFLLFVACCAMMQQPSAARQPACDEPIIPGTVSRFCDVISFHYGYNSETGTCVPFRYTGCKMGTNNNFRTQAECEAACID